MISAGEGSEFNYSNLRYDYVIQLNHLPTLIIKPKSCSAAVGCGYGSIG